MKTTLFSSSAGDIRADMAFVNNLSAVTDPGVGDDTADGYQVGSLWVNTAAAGQRVWQCMSATLGAAVWVVVSTSRTSTGLVFTRQGAPAAKTVSATLTAAEVLAGIITINQGAGAPSAQQLPTGTALQAALPASFAVDDSFDVSVMNISTNDLDDASITTNTDMTLVGSMDFPAHSGITLCSCGILRFRKTADHAFTVYRVG